MLDIGRHSSRRDLSICRVHQVQPRTVRIVIYPHRIGFIVMLLLLARCFRIVDQNRNVLPIGRDEISLDICFHWLGFCRFSASGRIFCGRNRVRRRRLIDRRHDLHLERMRFAAIHRQPDTTGYARHDARGIECSLHPASTGLRILRACPRLAENVSCRDIFVLTSTSHR